MRMGSTASAHSSGRWRSIIYCESASRMRSSCQGIRSLASFGTATEALAVPAMVGGFGSGCTSRLDESGDAPCLGQADKRRLPRRQKTGIVQFGTISAFVVQGLPYSRSLSFELLIRQVKRLSIMPFVRLDQRSSLYCFAQYRKLSKRFTATFAHLCSI